MGIVVAAPLVFLGVFVTYGIVRFWRGMYWFQRELATVVVFTTLAVANRIVFMEVMHCRLGGLPSHGKIEHGRYFVGDRQIYHEVSAATYRDSMSYETWSGRAALISIVALVISWGYAGIARKNIPKDGTNVAPSTAVAVKDVPIYANVVRRRAILLNALSITSGVGTVIGAWLCMVPMLRGGRPYLMFGVAVGCCVVCIVSHIMGRREWTRFDSERKDDTRCRNCGYSLRGNTSGVCPECGVGRDGGRAAGRRLQRGR
jgi:hypothetical protein